MRLITTTCLMTLALNSFAYQVLGYYDSLMPGIREKNVHIIGNSSLAEVFGNLTDCLLKNNVTAEIRVDQGDEGLITYGVFVEEYDTRDVYTGLSYGKGNSTGLRKCMDEQNLQVEIFTLDGPYSMLLAEGSLITETDSDPLSQDIFGQMHISNNKNVNALKIRGGSTGQYGGKGVYLLSGVVQLWSAMAFASRMTASVASPRCGQCYSTDGTIGGSVSLTNGLGYEVDVVVWPHLSQFPKAPEGGT